MGVSNFYPLVTQRASEAIEYLDTPPDLREVNVGVDIAILLHRARSSVSCDSEFLPYVAEKIYWLQSLGARVVAIFDGDNIPEKKEEQQRRQFEREKNEVMIETEESALKELENDEISRKRQGIENLENDDEISRKRQRIENLKKRVAKPSLEDKQNAWDLLIAMGCYCYKAQGEGEAELAAFQISEIIQEIITEDSDTIVCGAKSILKNFWNLQGTTFELSSSRKPQRVTTGKILECLKIDQRSLRVACILAGCDFIPKEYHIPKVGLKRAIDAVIQHGPSLTACFMHFKGLHVLNDLEALKRYNRAIEILKAPQLDARKIEIIRMSLSNCPIYSDKCPRRFYILSEPLIPEEWLSTRTN